MRGLRRWRKKRGPIRRNRNQRTRRHDRWRRGVQGIYGLPEFARAGATIWLLNYKAKRFSSNRRCPPGVSAVGGIPAVLFQQTTDEFRRHSHTVNTRRNQMKRFLIASSVICLLMMATRAAAPANFAGTWA